MYAKIKNNEVVTFPYGFDELQADNPHTRFTGVIIIPDLFDLTEEKILKGYDLAEVKQIEKPHTTPFQEATLNDKPTLNDNGEWELGWTVKFKPPSEDK
jgi:hypothetical protein